jgi:hypothetical protein
MLKFQANFGAASASFVEAFSSGTARDPEPAG